MYDFICETTDKLHTCSIYVHKYTCTSLASLIDHSSQHHEVLTGRHGGEEPIHYLS